MNNLLSGKNVKGGGGTFCSTFPCRLFLIKGGRASLQDTPLQTCLLSNGLLEFRGKKLMQTTTAQKNSRTFSEPEKMERKDPKG